MPSRTLPTFTRAEVESHKSSKSCYVSIGSKVFDITDFVDDHPGGGNLILEYGGRDVGEILKDEVSHTHTEAAYEILDDYLVGFVVQSKSATTDGSAQPNGTAVGDDTFVHPRTGMSCAEDLSKDTDVVSDYKKHKFLDLNRPLIPQVWCGGFSREFYLDQVHRPRHYKGGRSAPLFGNFLEPLTMTPWWVVPTLWGPLVAYGTYVAAQGLSSTQKLVAYWGLGLFVWTFVEYCLHRFLFHLDQYVVLSDLLQPRFTNASLQVPAR
jgi:4-hydroxysphinganine ceramide fatty acyl 2-hydroxylase